MFDALQKDFSSGQSKPLYFLSGEESYYIDQLVAIAEEKLIPETEKDFNLEIYYGIDSTIKGVIDSCRNRPLIGTRKLIILKEAQEIKNWEDIIPYSKNPSSTSSLIITYKQKKPDGRQAWVKSLKENAVYFESKSLYDYQIPGFIKDLAHKKKMNLDPQAISLLAEYVGNNLSHIENELEKIKLVSKEGELINADQISNFVGISRENNVFELCKAFSYRDSAKIYSIMNNISENIKSNPLIPMITSLFNHFQKIWLCKFYSDKKDQELTVILKLAFASFLKEYREAASNYKLDSLHKVFSTLKEYDFKSKGIHSGGASQSELFKELVLKISQL